jgi:predicted metal-binding membrane protein
MAQYLILALTRGPRPWLILISLAGWGLLLSAAQMLSIPAFCGTLPVLDYAASWQGIEQALLFNPPRQLLSSWWLMLLAMMPLLLVHPLDYLWRRSLLRKRWQAVVLFVIGFSAIWTLAGVVLMGLTVGARVMLGFSPMDTLIVALGVCLIWQASPFKQACLNHCHHQPRISAFGLDFLKDCLKYGMVSAGWCVGSCWALMLLPMLAEQGHLPLMLLSMGWMLWERFKSPRPVRWYWPRLFH